MQITCNGDYAASQVRQVLNRYGLYERNGYTKQGPFIRDPKEGGPQIFYSISGGVPSQLRAELEAMADVTVEA